MKFIDSEMMERYLRGESNLQEKHSVMMWLMLNLKDSSADDDFQELLGRIPENIDNGSRQRVKGRLNYILETDKQQVSGARKKYHWILNALMPVACVVMAILVAVNIRTGNVDDQIVSWTEVATSYGEKLSVVLPDSSVIWLRNDSKIMYPDSFGDDIRQVFVSGEIYADITKDSKRPLVMSSDSVNVIVKGTTFNFRAYPGTDNVELTLVEGSVSLDCMTRRGRKQMNVTPGAVVTVNMNNGNVGKFLCDTSTYVSWKEQRAMYFNDLTLEQIVEELHKEFNYPIVIVDKALGHTRHFASFVNDESLMDILNALCLHSGMKVEENDGIIYISNN